MFPEKVLDEAPPDADLPVHSHYASHGLNATPDCIAACGRKMAGFPATKSDWIKKPCPECLEARTGLREPVECPAKIW